MSEYALATNLYTFASLRTEPPFFGWPSNSGEAEVILTLTVGDLIVPKFAQSATYSGDTDVLDRQKAYCDSLGLDYQEVLHDYESTVGSGTNVTPFLLRVATTAHHKPGPGGEEWSAVGVQLISLDCAISTSAFLRLRPIPETIAAQFKASVAPGRHLQELPPGTAEAIRSACASGSLDSILRKYSVVQAQSPVSARQILEDAGRAPLPGDRAFVAGQGGLLGVHVEADGELLPITEPIPRSPSDLVSLFDTAARRAQPQDYFAPRWAKAAAEQLQDLLDGPGDLIVVDDFARFHDCYELLPQKITQALELAKRTLPAESQTTSESDEEDALEDPEIDELAALAGLTVDAVRAVLPADMILPDAVIAEAVTALRAGKHLLLGGPPGTGKTTLGEALCRAVVANQFDVATATADWSTFDTIGGYVPHESGLKFEPGVVLRTLRRGQWLVIDEINRADIDKAFGPLFTLLASAGASASSKRVVLPYSEAGRHIEIRTAETRGSGDNYVVTPGWRLIGTLNISDKASLFQLSFAFLRRFAVVNVPIPARAEYLDFMRSRFGTILGDDTEAALHALANLAEGPRQLGPAIISDIAQFVDKALAEDAGGHSAYSSPTDALITAIRLFAAPQYEGASKHETEGLVQILESGVPGAAGSDAMATLSAALVSVAL